MEAKVRSVDCGTIKQTEIVVGDDTFLVDTNNIEEAAKQSPMGMFAGMVDEMCGSSNLPFETMICLPDGDWASFSKSNYATEEEALAQHLRFVAYIKAGEWELCEGNDDSQVQMCGDEREQEADDDDSSQ